MKKFEVVEIDGELYVPLKDFMALKATTEVEIPQKNEAEQPETKKRRKRRTLCAECGKRKGVFTYRGCHGNKVCGWCLKKKNQNGNGHAEAEEKKNLS